MAQDGVYFDHETTLPLHFKLYDFDGGMSGEYAFADFVPNATMAGAFDTPKL